MIQKKNIKNTEFKYSEMLISIAEKFDNQLPVKLDFEAVLDIVIDAWNLANNKPFLVEKSLYEKELKAYKYNDVIENIVDYKIEKYSEFNNIILDYSTKDNILQVKTQTQENYFDNMLSKMISFNPNKESDTKKNN